MSGSGLLGGIWRILYDGIICFLLFSPCSKLWGRPVAWVSDVIVAHLMGREGDRRGKGEREGEERALEVEGRGVKDGWGIIGASVRHHVNGKHHQASCKYISSTHAGSPILPGCWRSESS